MPDGHWHYVATSYRFGAPESIAGYCDGEKVKGKWDMAGPTQRAPIVDNDALWIGSSRGGEKGNSLRGALDNIAIHRELVSAEILNSRRRPVVRPLTFPADHDDSRVTITLHAEQSSHSSGLPLPRHRKAHLPLATWHFIACLCVTWQADFARHGGGPCCCVRFVERSCQP